MWYRMMAVAFFTNGFGAFGARVLDGLGLAKTHAWLYLAFWYTAGFAIALFAYVMQTRPQAASANPTSPQADAPGAGTPGPRGLIQCTGLAKREIVIGGGMALCSAVGWFLLTLAIAEGVPGYLVFPIAIGGSLSVVAAVGVIGFKERLSGAGYTGIALGIAGIVLLTV